MLKLFLVAAVVAFSRAEVTKEEIMGQVQACISEIQPESEELDLLEKREPPISDKGKCLRACVFEKMGFMKDGVLDTGRTIEIMHEVYTDEPAKQALSKETILFCGKELEDQTLTSCDLATSALTCFKNKSPTLYFA